MFIAATRGVPDLLLCCPRSHHDGPFDAEARLATRQGSARPAAPRLADLCAATPALGSGLPARSARSPSSSSQRPSTWCATGWSSRSSPAPVATSSVSGATSLMLLPAARHLACGCLALGAARHGRRADPGRAEAGGRGGPPVPAVTRQASVKRLVLSRPVIELRVDAQGRRSWDFALAAERPAKAARAGTTGDAPPQLIPVSAPAQAAAPSARGADLSAMLEMLSPTSVRIVDGTVRYVDERSGQRHEVTAHRRRPCPR